MIYPSMISENNNYPYVIRKIQKRRREKVMASEILLSCIGKTCNITTGSIGNSYSKVVVVEVVDNWIKVEKGGKIEIINTDYVDHIKILD